MKRASKWAVGLATAVILTAAAGVWFFYQEPFCHGHRLSYWVEQLWSPGADQEEARSALRTIGAKAVPYLLAQAKTGIGTASPADPGSGAFRRNRLGQRIPYAISLVGSPALPQLIDAMRDPDRDVRLTAAQALAYLGDRADLALPGLLALLEQPNPEIRLDAITAISKMSLIRTQAIPALILQLDDVSVRENAARALGGMGPAGEPAIPALTAWLNDPDPAVRLEGTAALWQIHRDSNLVDRVLEELHNRQTAYTYRGYLNLLTQMRRSPRSAVPDLPTAFASPDTDPPRTFRRGRTRMSSGNPSVLGADSP